MKHVTKHKTLFKTVAVFLYLAIGFEWILAALPYTLTIMKSDTYRSYVPSKEVPQNAITFTAPDFIPPWVVLGVVLLFAFAALVIAAKALSKAPRIIAKADEKIVQQTTKTVLPIAMHHKPMTVKKKKVLTARITLVLKLLVIGVPLLLVLIVPYSEQLAHLPRQILLVGLCLIAAWAYALTALELLLSKLLKVPLQKIW